MCPFLFFFLLSWATHHWNDNWSLILVGLKNSIIFYLVMLRNSVTSLAFKLEVETTVNWAIFVCLFVYAICFEWRKKTFFFLFVELCIFMINLCLINCWLHSKWDLKKKTTFFNIRLNCVAVKRRLLDKRLCLKSKIVDEGHVKVLPNFGWGTGQTESNPIHNESEQMFRCLIITPPTLFLVIMKNVLARLSKCVFFYMFFYTLRFSHW